MSAKQKATQRQANVESEKERRKREEEEKKAQAEWSVGTKDTSKLKALEDKDAEKRKKAAEKAALLAVEEELLNNVKRVAKTPKKKDEKDDFALLSAALASQPKTKAQKEAETKRKADEERMKKEEEARERKAARLKAQEDEIKKAAAKGLVLNHSDAYMIKIDNRLPDDDGSTIEASGLDATVHALSVGLGKVGVTDYHPEKRGKALYKSFSAARLPSLKEELPGLKLSQYQERLFDEWKVHPDNPRNQKAARARDGEVSLGYDPTSDDIEIEQYEV